MTRGDGFGDSGIRAFDPPEEDADQLERAARAAEHGAERLRREGSEVEGASAEAMDTWSGRRRDLFARGAVALQVWLRSQQRGTAELAGILHAYARLVRRTAEEIAGYHRAYLRELAAKADAESRIANSELPHGLDPVFDPTYEARAAAALEDVRVAQRRADQYVEQAEEAHRDLRRRVRELVAAIDASIDLLIPGGSRLSSADLTTHAHLQLGIGGTGPRGGGGSGIDALMAVLTLTEGLAATVPADAVNADRTVDWKALTRQPVVPRTGTDPIQVTAWWEGLSVLQQARVLEAQPTGLGNLDGLPAIVRDAANRASIKIYRRELTDYLRRFTEGRAALDLDLMVQLGNKLKALDAVEKVIAKPNRQLLVLDPFAGEQLHAAVGVGDVDTAAHLSVLTTGLGSNVQDGLASYDKRMYRMQVLATMLSGKYGDRDSVATVTWLGYDAPQKGELFDWHDTVARSELAKRGGTALAGFLAGTTSARGELATHLNAFGHSYGSLATGYALRHRDTGVETAVLFGSPGPGTTKREDLRVPPRQLYFAEADWDPVADADWFGTDPSHLDDIKRLQTDAADTPIGHLDGVHGHTAYLDDGSTSQYNLAAITAGIDPRYLVTAPLGGHDKPGGFPFKLFNPPSGGLAR